MGIFRSLGALARAIGPVVSCTGEPSVLIGSPVGQHAKLLVATLFYTLTRNTTCSPQKQLKHDDGKTE